MDFKDIINTSFTNEKSYCEYYRKDTIIIINKLIKFNNELEIKDETIGYLKKLRGSLNYSKKKQCYEQNVEVYNTDNIGRYYVKNKPSLQSLPSKIKNTLIDAERYVDFDIVNSAPSILLNICRIKGWKCNFLTEYCSNRDVFLKELMTKCKIKRKNAKRLFISMMFGADYISWVKELWEKYPHFKIENIPEWVETIYDELYTIMNNAYNCDDFEKIKNIVLKKRKDNNCFVKKNPKASVLANILFNIENVIIQRVEKYFNENTTFVVDTPAFDGFNLRITTHKNDIKPTDDELKRHIERTQQLIKNEYDLDIEFALKGYTDNYIVQLRELDNNDDKTIVINGVEYPFDEIVFGVNDECEAMEKIIKLFPNYFKICDNTLYMYHEGLWTDNDIYIKSFMRKYADYIHKLKYNQKTHEYENSNISYGKSITLLNNLITSFNNNEDLLDNKLLNTDATITSQGKLLFNNGILSATKDGYRFSEVFNHKVIFKTKIDDDFRKTRDDEKIKEIKYDFFERMYFENADYVIKFIACALFGCNLKKTLFIIGRTNSGKSFLTELLGINLSKDLIGNFELRKFKYNKFQDSDDKHLGWVIKESEKRLLISNESFNGKIDCEMFKRVCSGGTDAISGRALYRESIEVKPKFMMLCFMNPDKMPSFYGADDAVKDRISIVNLKGGFVKSEDEIEDEKLDYLMGDRVVLLNKYTSKDYCDAMRWLLIDAYIDYLKNGIGKVFIDEDDETIEIDDGLGYVRETIRENIEYVDGDIYMTSKEFNDWVFNSNINSLKSNNVKSKLMKEFYKDNGKPFGWVRETIDKERIRVYKNIQFKTL